MKNVPAGPGLFTINDTYIDSESVRYILPVLKDEIEKIEKEIQWRDELDESISLEYLDVKKILKVDYANRKIIRYTRYVSPSGDIVKRTKEVFNISTVGMLDSRDNDRCLLMCSGGFHFVYFKKANGFAPAILSDKEELIELPKDFLNRFKKHNTKSGITKTHGGNRLSITKHLEANDTSKKRKKKCFIL